MKVYEIELKAAYTHISNSAQAKRDGTSVDGNPMPTVPSKVAKSAKPGCPKAAHRIKDERLYKSLFKSLFNRAAYKSVICFRSDWRGPRRNDRNSSYRKRKGEGTKGGVK